LSKGVLDSLNKRKNHVFTPFYAIPKYFGVLPDNKSIYYINSS
jgi:hypothetical protein